MRIDRIVTCLAFVFGLSWQCGVVLAQVPAPAPAPGPVVVQSGGAVMLGLGVYVVMAALAVVAVCKSSRRV